MGCGKLPRGGASGISFDRIVWDKLVVAILGGGVNTAVCGVVGGRAGIGLGQHFDCSRSSSRAY